MALQPADAAKRAESKADAAKASVKKGHPKASG
jgi:hypothetical protein